MSDSIFEKQRIYVSVESLGAIIKDIDDRLQNEITDAKVKGDSVGASLRRLEYSILSEVRMRILTEAEILNAEQVAAENAESMVNDMAEKEGEE